MRGSLDLAADALQQMNCFQQLFHLAQEVVAPFDRVAQRGQGRGIKLVTA
jgi:hypothetical protein